MKIVSKTRKTVTIEFNTDELVEFIVALDFKIKSLEKVTKSEQDTTIS